MIETKWKIKDSIKDSREISMENGLDKLIYNSYRYQQTLDHLKGDEEKIENFK